MKIVDFLKFKFNLISFSFIIIVNISFIPKLKTQMMVPINKNMNSYYIKIFFDKEKKKSEFVKVNMALDFTFIPLSFNYSSSTPNSDIKLYLENEIVEVDNKEFNTKLISTNNFLLEERNNININNFKFFYIFKNDINKEEINYEYKVYNNLYFGQLGLSPIYNDNNLNLLYALKEQNIINQLSFVVILGKNINYLFFGNIDKTKNELFKETEFSHIITLDQKILKKYNRWGMKIDAIVLEKTNEIVKHTKHKYFAYFNLIEDRIFVPDKIMEYLITRIFSPYIKIGICFITEYSDKRFINCKKDKILEEKDNFPKISFVIKKFGFELAFDDLFIDSRKENELIFIIQKNYYDIDTSIILLGSRFFKKYIIEFNLEKYSIAFHSEKVLPIIDLDQIEDDSWRDLIRDYNKEIEHYDSNYGDDKEENGKKGDDINEKIGNKDDLIEEKTEEENDNNNKKENNKDNEKIKIEFDYDFLYKILWILLFIFLIFAGICVYFKFRKKIRIENEKKYFNQPLNDEKNSV